MASASLVTFLRQGILRRVRARRLAPLAIFSGIVMGCLWPAVAAARTPTHVACVGDSITYGYLASSPSASYPSDLQKMFGSSVSVMNFGHSSATMLSVGDLPYQKQSEYTAATSFVSGAGASATVAVVIMLGTNDSKPGNWMSGGSTRATQFQTDTAAMVDHFAQLGTHPTVYLAIPPRVYTNTFGIDDAVMQNQIDPILRDVAASKGLATIDVDTPTTSHAELFSDGVHPTDTGYTLVAMIVHTALVSGGSGGGGAGGAAGTGGGGGGSAHSGGTSGGGHGGPAGGATGSGGTSPGGTGGASSTGGAGTGGAGTGGTPASGTGGTGTGGTHGTGGTQGTGGTPGTGGAGTGGANLGSGGQVAATGGVTSSSTGGTGGSNSAATGGRSTGGGETNGSGGGCAIGAGGLGDGCPERGVALSILVLLVARARRKRGSA